MGRWVFRYPVKVWCGVRFQRKCFFSFWLVDPEWMERKRATWRLFVFYDVGGTRRRSIHPSVLELNIIGACRRQ